MSDDTASTITTIPDYSDATPPCVPSVYSNGVVTRVSPVEVILDFYHVTPPASESDNSEDILYRKHVQRIVIPLSTAKEIGRILTESMKEFETTYGITLPVRLPETLKPSS